MSSEALRPGDSTALRSGTRWVDAHVNILHSRGTMTFLFAGRSPDAKAHIGNQACFLLHSPTE